MSLTDRLRTWRAARRERPTPEDPAVQYGRDAELSLRQLVATHFNHKGAHLFAGRRVPCPRRGMRREIDLIVLTRSLITLIEIKNWSGALEDHGDYWLHVRRVGEAVRHPNLIADNRDKRDVFLGYLRKQGHPLEPDLVAQKIVFMNASLALSPSIRSHPDVVTRDKLAAFLDAQQVPGLARRLFGSVVEFCLGSEAARGLTGTIPAERFAALVKCVGAIPTWDRLRLYGGRVLTGDVSNLYVGGHYLPREQLGHGGALRVKWSRGVWGLAKVLAGWGAVGTAELPGRGVTALGEHDLVVFHAVGEAAASVPLTRVEEIVLG